MQNQMLVVLVTNHGGRFEGWVHANDVVAAEVFARTWARLNGYVVGFVNVYPHGEMTLAVK